MHIQHVLLGLVLSTAVLCKPLPTDTSTTEESITKRKADPLEIDIVVRPGSDRGLLALPVPEIPDLADITSEVLDRLLPGGKNGVEEPADVGLGGPSTSVSSMPALPVPSRQPLRFFPSNGTVNGTVPASRGSLAPFVAVKASANATVTVPSPSPSRFLFANASAPAAPSSSFSNPVVPQDLTEAILEDSIPFLESSNATKTKRAADAAPEPKPEALNIKLPSLLPGLPSLPGAGGVNTAACNTSNTQTNQCSSGIPYCCSPDGAGGQTCMNGNVQCQQTVICCNNFNGFQFCMGDIDFNIPITINMNVGGGGGGGGGRGGKKKNS